MYVFGWVAWVGPRWFPSSWIGSRGNLTPWFSAHRVGIRFEIRCHSKCGRAALSMPAALYFKESGFEESAYEFRFVHLNLRFDPTRALRTRCLENQQRLIQNIVQSKQVRNLNRTSSHYLIN